MSIEEIQRKYFEIIESHLGEIYKKGSKDPFEGAKHYASKNAGKFLFKIIPGFEEDISLFWKKNGVTIRNEVSKSPGLKTSFSGDIFPYRCDNLISRVGLYVDTVLLTDPLIKVLTFPDQFMSDKDRVYYVIKYVINVLNIQELFFKDLEYPLVCLYPNERYLDNNRQGIIFKETELDTLTYFNTLLGLEINSMEELTELLNVNEEALSEMINIRDLLPPNYSDKDSVKGGLIKGVSGAKSQGISYLENEPTGKHLLHYVYGRLAGISDHLMDCVELNSKALYNVPSSWFMYKWKMDNDFNKMNRKIGMDTSTSVVNALQLDEFEWLGNVPVDALIKIRQEGGLGEIRSIIRESVDEIYTCNQTDLEMVARDISKTLNEEFIKHESELKKINEDYQKKLNLLEKLLIVGTISITTSYFLPPLGALAIFGGGFNDVLNASDEYVTKIDEITEKPIGIMFNAFEDNDI